jgi:hypothetical protein
VTDGIVLSTAEIARRWAAAWTPAEVADRLAGVRTPWYVGGGWAVDLFLGRTTRPHGDLEIGVPAAGYGELCDRLPGHALDAVGDGRIWPDAGPAELAGTFQTWVRDPATGAYVLDIMREPHDGDTWLYRRDPTIRRPYAEVVRRTADGIPYLTPELVVLFKSKAPRPKDEADFTALLPHLPPGATALLPADHPWRARTLRG